MAVGRPDRIARALNRVVIVCALLAGLLPAAHAQTQNFQIDEYGSHRVTHFLHNHNLPLVGAQIIDNNDGSRELHLFGFVATPLGMRDAQQKALKYLGDPTLKVVNSIEVNPSLENMQPLTPSEQLPAAAETPAPPPANSNSQWDKTMENIYKNGAQPLPQPSGAFPR